MEMIDRMIYLPMQWEALVLMQEVTVLLKMLQVVQAKQTTVELLALDDFQVQMAMIMQEVVEVVELEEVQVAQAVPQMNVVQVIHKAKIIGVQEEVAVRYGRAIAQDATMVL